MESIDEPARVAPQIFVADVRKAQLRTAAAGYGGEYPVSGVPMEWMSLRTDDERIERGWVAQLEIRRGDLCRRLFQGVDEFAVHSLPCRDAVEELASGPMAQLRDQRHLNREAAASIWNDRSRKRVNDTRKLRHRTSDLERYCLFYIRKTPKGQRNAMQASRCQLLDRFQISHF
jgi:hypothetical protein